MATLIRTDVVVHLPVAEYERMVIEANRRMAELCIVRIDRRPVTRGPWKEPQK
jgi:hypothetical protein